MGESYLQQVRAESQIRLAALNDELSSAREIIGREGTIFATGSYGRLEASPESDLDVFIVVRSKEKGDPPLRVPRLDQVRQIRFKSELIVAAKKAGMAEFDAGGRFLDTHIYEDIVEETGSPSDDFKNTFTGRMLLILESRSLIGDDTYCDLKNDSIAWYFRDFEGNESDFVPYFLLNDILRMWRTFCVNYEFFRGDTSDWRIKNLKLKYTRILTCYSAIISLAAVYRKNGTVTPSDVFALSSHSPIERLDMIRSDQGLADLGLASEVSECAGKIISEYGEFLEFVQEKTAAIKALKSDEELWRERSYEFSLEIAKLLQIISGDGLNNRIYRGVIV